ncbi:MAG: acyl-CoA desaturase [Bacteroidota bacterium]|nr:acyl-CoA desaturase [Bacteroidota bacterium]
MAVQIRFNNAGGMDFYNAVRSRVDGYFKDKGISQHGNWEMIFKVVFYISGLAVPYLLLVLGNFSVPVQFLLWGLVGFFSACIGLNICHDAIHGALSGNKTLNKSLGLLFNVVGANAYLWSIMHNVVHHTYTNIEGHDEDIESVPILRMSPHQKLRKVHRYQYLFALPMYGFGSISWVFFKDYIKFFKKKIGNYDTKNHPKIEYFNLFFFKAVYYTLFLIIPLIVISAPWYVILGGFVFGHLIEGFTLAIVFMLAHVVEETHFPIPDEKGRMQNAWAIHQLYTTANFARNNRLANFICGGLNFQIEHHLFPKICHVHYRPISEIVKKTALEYNLPYYDNPSFMGAVRSHVRFLKRLGREEAPVFLPAEQRVEAA